MPTPHETRRKALQALYLLDARGEGDLDAIRASLEEPERFTARDLEKSVELALSAFRARLSADDAIRTLAPEWPPHRQPAIDRAIVRLGHFELATARAHAAIVINEAVELAKEFSTEKSPAFVNAVLDKIAKASPHAGESGASVSEVAASAAPGEPGAQNAS